jgi:hypothetical protein
MVYLSTLCTVTDVIDFYASDFSQAALRIYKADRPVAIAIIRLYERDTRPLIPMYSFNWLVYTDKTAPIKYRITALSSVFKMTKRVALLSLYTMFPNAVLHTMTSEEFSFIKEYIVPIEWHFVPDSEQFILDRTLFFQIPEV